MTVSLLQMRHCVNLPVLTSDTLQANIPTISSTTITKTESNARVRCNRRMLTGMRTGTLIMLRRLVTVLVLALRNKVFDGIVKPHSHWFCLILRGLR